MRRLRPHNASICPLAPPSIALTAAVCVWTCLCMAADEAKQSEWKGNDGKWDVPEKWDNGVPGPKTSALIPKANAEIPRGVEAKCSTLSVTGRPQDKAACTLNAGKLTVWRLVLGNSEKTFGTFSLKKGELN